MPAKKVQYYVLLLILWIPALAVAQYGSSEEFLGDEFIQRQIIPLPKYISITPIKGGSSPDDMPSFTKGELRHIIVAFNRDSLRPDDGPQFVKIVTTVNNKDGSLHDKFIQYAFTFGREQTSDEDEDRMKQYASEILPFGFVSRRKIDSVDVHLDSVPDWSVISIEISPDEEYTKYSRRFDTRIIQYFRAKGNRFETGFYVGIPKVLYDTNSKDTMTYGNASAMLRLFLLDGNTGVRFPFSLGIGTFGVSTPIDVTDNGGGFAISVLLDMVQFSRYLGLDLSSKVNAGIEVTPFFPLVRQPRLLLNAKVGFTP